MYLHTTKGLLQDPNLLKKRNASILKLIRRINFMKRRRDLGLEQAISKAQGKYKLNIDDVEIIANEELEYQLNTSSSDEDEVKVLMEGMSWADEMK